MNVPVKKGMLLRHEGRLYFVESFMERHSGQQKPAVHVTLRDAMGGRHIERTLDELVPLEEVASAYRTMQYLYSKGSARIFMDSETFEELELSGVALQGFEPFLKEGDEFRVLFAGEQPLRLDVPDSVALEVSDTAAATHAIGTSANIMKEARLENGLEVHVPLFIKTGDTIRINTQTKEYLGKSQVS